MSSENRSRCFPIFLAIAVFSAAIYAGAAAAADGAAANSGKDVEQAALEAIPQPPEYKLPRQDTPDLIVVAADEERRKSGDLYQFARLINEQFPREQKLAVLELLWQVVYSDGVLEAHEDALLHKMGTLLGVRHEELMALKVKVKREKGL